MDDGERGADDASGEGTDRPDASDASDAPDASDVSDSPGAPDAHGAPDAPDALESGGSAGAGDTPDAADASTQDEAALDGVESEISCPECGGSLPAEARFCPYCSTALDDDGAAVDLSEFDGDGLPADPASLLLEDDEGHRRASGRVRVLAGLAVSIPLAPLILFLVGTVVSLSLWTGALVFLGGWLLSAAILSRARVPAEAFGRSLYLIAICTLFVPVAVRVGSDGSPGGSAQVSFEVVAVGALVIAAVALALGTFVTNQARKRVTGEQRAFEESREG